MIKVACLFSLIFYFQIGNGRSKTTRSEPLTKFNADELQACQAAPRMPRCQASQLYLKKDFPFQPCVCIPKSQGSCQTAYIAMHVMCRPIAYVFAQHHFVGKHRPGVNMSLANQIRGQIGGTGDLWILVKGQWCQHETNWRYLKTFFINQSLSLAFLKLD